MNVSPVRVNPETIVAAGTVAVAWVLAQPDITAPIVGATSPEQLRQSLPATELTLDAEELEVCNEVWFTIPRLSDPTVALR